MLLSNLIDKKIVSGKNTRGVCKGVAISLKTYRVKYLLCASSTANGNSVDFAVNVSAISAISDGIFLSSLRPVYPKNCTRFFLGLPAFNTEGVFLGTIDDMDMEDFLLREIFIGKNTYVPTAISACNDAVIFKKQPPYPLGQRVPAPLLLQFCNKNEWLVTKSVLRTAMEKGKLLTLTLSLPPFSLST